MTLSAFLHSHRDHCRSDPSLVTGAATSLLCAETIEVVLVTGKRPGRNESCGEWTSSQQHRSRKRLSVIQLEPLFQLWSFHRVAVSEQQTNFLSICSYPFNLVRIYFNSSSQAVIYYRPISAALCVNYLLNPLLLSLPTCCSNLSGFVASSVAMCTRHTPVW